MPVTLFGAAYSTYTRSAMLTLAEKGVPYTLDSGWRRRHPWQKMPVLEHDGFQVYEAAAVMRYVDEAFDGPALQPADVRARARMTQWMSAFNDYVAPKAVRGVLIPRLVLAPRGMEVDEAAIARNRAAAHDALGRFEAALAESPFLVGDAPTLADWLLLPVVTTNDVLADADQYVGGYVHLGEWADAMKARSSYAATSPA